MDQVSLTPMQRLFLAFVAFFAVLLDRRFAEGVKQLRERELALPPGAPLVTPAPAADETIATTPAQPPPGSPASELATPAPVAAPVVAPVPPPTPTPPPTPAAAPAAEPTALAAPVPPPVPAPSAEPAAAAPAAVPAAPPVGEALQVLALLQRDGRLVDFVSEDLTGFTNAEIGAAARTVHEGCRKVIQAYVELEPVYREPEGASVTVADGFDPSAVRLTGNVVGSPPFQGSLRHHGWRVKHASFPPWPSGSDVRILAPAEVEL
jgi:hypothetical protein